MLLQNSWVAEILFAFQILSLFCGLRNVNCADSPSVETLIDNLVRGNKAPTVVYVNANDKARQHSYNHASHHRDYDVYQRRLYKNLGEDSVENDGRISTYWLDYLLRSTTDLRSKNQPVNSDVSNALRYALRSQCKKLNKCEAKCVNGKVECKITCQIIFDDGKKCKPKRPTTTTPRDECVDDSDQCNRKK